MGCHKFFCETNKSWVRYSIYIYQYLLPYIRNSQNTCYSRHIWSLGFPKRCIQIYHIIHIHMHLVWTMYIGTYPLWPGVSVEGGNSVGLTRGCPSPLQRSRNIGLIVIGSYNKEIKSFAQLNSIIIWNFIILQTLKRNDKYSTLQVQL